MIIIGISLQQLDIKNSKQYLKSLKQNIDILKFSFNDSKYCLLFLISIYCKIIHFIIIIKK